MKVSSVSPPTEECVSCLEDLSVHYLWLAPCDQWYCFKGLGKMISIRLEEPGFRLPKCCGRIFEWEDMRRKVNGELAAAFDKKKEEFESIRPTYCTDRTCPGSSALIGAQHISPDDATATCPICKKVVCIDCKQDSHSGACVPDVTLEEVLKLADRDCRGARIAVS